VEDAVVTLPFTTDAAALVRDGFVVLPETYASTTAAWTAARAVMSGVDSRDLLCSGAGPSLEPVGEFVIPPPDRPQRDFQALHVDFGVPLGTSERVDVARYTALYVDPDMPASRARTRLVPLRRLAGQRDWPGPDELARRLPGRLGTDGSAGVLGRLIEAVDRTFDLPSQDSPGFLCGLEHTTLAHELHQLCVGFRQVDRGGQRSILRAFLRGLTGQAHLEPSSLRRWERTTGSRRRRAAGRHSRRTC
jgi:hypothetical protein